MTTPSWTEPSAWEEKEEVFLPLRRVGELDKEQLRGLADPKFDSFEPLSQRPRHLRLLVVAASSWPY